MRKHGESAKHTAKVLGIGHDCDLAVLSVDDEGFWDNVKDYAIELAEVVPELQSRVSVVGFPLGGDNLSITSGVVSRVDYQEYSHSTASLLALQIDAAINSGNSGGPAFYKGRAAGVAFQALEDAENIGYVIPTPIVKHFLKDIEAHGKATGFGRIGIQWQNLENSFLRKYLKLKNDNRGVLINKVNKTAKAANVLQKEDVVSRLIDLMVIVHRYSCAYWLLISRYILWMIFLLPAMVRYPFEEQNESILPTHCLSSLMARKWTWKFTVK